MSNHFHILVRVPPVDTEISEAELLDRYAALYGEEKRLRLECSWARRREKGRGESVEKERGQALPKAHPYAASRIRCFTYGAAFGREAFVKKAGTGIAFPAEAEGLCTARPLAVEP